MLKQFSIISLAVLALAACCAFAWTSKSQTRGDSSGRIKIMDYPKVFQGREPIKLKDLGGLTFQIKNTSKQSIKKFILYFVAASGDLPLHGPGAHAHILPIYWGYDTDKLIPARETVDISLDDGMKFFAKQPDANINNTEIWAFEVHFQDESKMWRMGKYLRRSGENWEEDTSLNPARPRQEGVSLNAARPRIDTGRCYDYDNFHQWPSNFCTNAACTTCRFSAPLFRSVEGGYPVRLSCVYCLNEFGTICQKPNGSGCTQLNVNDLDFSNPCQ
jgi:hypothetical protein